VPTETLKVAAREATDPKATDPEVAAALDIVRELFAGYERPDYAVRFWDGTIWQPDANVAPTFTLVFKHRGSMRRTFWPPSPMSFGSSFIFGDIDVEGDMVAFTYFGRFLEATPKRISLWRRMMIGLKIFRLPKYEPPRVGRGPARLRGKVHSLERDQQAIRYHYDLSNDFFRIALGPSMVYTSAIWEPGDDLETAQRRKLDLLYTKLRLKPGERLLDIGCGWGAPLMHAAKHYGAKCVGVTISERQAEHARKSIQDAGLSEQCRIELRDYRELSEPNSFDKIVMIEVGEHFGFEQTKVYFRKCFELLRPGGQLMIQQITVFGTRRGPATRRVGNAFVFPDGELVPCSWLLQCAENAGFDVRDVESIREQYPKTLDCWLGNVEANKDEIIALTDAASYQTFRLYFGAAKYGYETNIYNLHHMLFVKPDGNASPVPESRHDWYAGR
jgi:cyclopropane-fatty-acyl-phospholipid synthase